jgi:signal transduction histidine kinase
MENVLKSVAGEGIPVRVDLEPRLWPVRADPRQVEQALVNLAVNARDAMPSGGTLRITLHNARDPVVNGKNEIVPPGDYVSIAVSDTGSGIDAATMPRIFEPFFTTKEVGKGTGLGLSTVYGIMKQTGGYVCANSSPGRGSEFTLYFVRAQEDENGGAKETNGAAHAKAEPEAHARIRLHRG